MPLTQTIHRRRIRLSFRLLFAVLCSLCGIALAAEKAPPSSYSPVVIKETPEAVMNRMKGEKPAIMKRQMDLLNQRYDLANRPDKGATMTRGKPIQEGVRVKLPKGITWDSLAAMEPAVVKEKDLFPAGCLPLPHANHPEGGMIFPKFHIDEIKKQEERDLTRFDLDFDVPDHFLPEFPDYLPSRHFRS